MLFQTNISVEMLMFQTSISVEMLMLFQTLQFHSRQYNIGMMFFLCVDVYPKVLHS